jgi:protein TonB
VTPSNVPPGGQPFDRVLDLGAGPRRKTSTALIAALLAHAGIAAGVHAREEAWGPRAPDCDLQELAIEEELAKPPPEPERPPPPEPPKAPASVQPVANEEPPPVDPPEEPGSSEAAEAGEVLVQEDEAEEEDEEDDTDDNTFVTGNADHYAGGATASNGTSAAAVTGAVVDAGGVPFGRGIAGQQPPHPTIRDLSRGAWLDGSTSWDCDFPGEADRDRIDSAVVGLSVDVSSSGRALAVRVVEDPGHGFARMASACALKHPYTPALDPKGKPVAGTTGKFRVGFHR